MHSSCRDTDLEVLLNKLHQIYLHENFFIVTVELEKTLKRDGETWRSGVHLLAARLYHRCFTSRLFPFSSEYINI